MGRLVMTSGVESIITTAEMRVALASCIRRHMLGDWGDVDVRDKRVNDSAVAEGGRVLSVYHLPDQSKIYIVTEADRSSTCILLWEEY
jgi:hypothetical protein